MSYRETLEIRELTSADEQQAIDAHQTMLADDFEFLPTWTQHEAWEDYIYRMNAGRRGEHIPPGWVRSALFAAFDQGGELVGRVSVRYELNDSLLQYGGHIGYGVLPEFRRRGVAVQLCQFALRQVRDAGVKQALLTCDSTNVGSQTTIKKCGGVLDAEFPVLESSDGTSSLRFWIPTVAKD
ncbi:GNAT family N-acetyltransferase [Glutamicibacter sp. JC586]|uniref:GNAT family N-acetyltransferase n=1 Tax=Glutamicibacter sp. JC586 TaxID=2590552 RepID=UPI00135CF235|nr:GNAT family N-acetyltransferase [Glutamicibacter sp. JC586]